MACLQVLDAPALQDDFYLNLLDWSPQGLLAVGLGTEVWVFNYVTSKASHRQLTAGLGSQHVYATKNHTVRFPVLLPLSNCSEQVCLESSGLLQTHLALAGTRRNYYY